MRRMRAMARALLIYGLLLGGAFVFVIPFAWMVGTSFKVDREMFGERITLFPARPVPVASSPYLDNRYSPEKKDERYLRIKSVIRKAILEQDLPLPSHVRGLDQAADVLIPGVFKRVTSMLPETLWGGADEELFSEVRSRITPELMAELCDRVHRRLGFGPVRVRSHDLQEEDVTIGVPISEFWQVESDVPARLVASHKADDRYADLVYEFQGKKTDQIQLSRTIDLPFAAERLYRTEIYLQPDDSWHPIDFYMEKNGRLFKGKYPQHMGNFLRLAVILQEYGAEDKDPNKIKLWIPLMRQDEGPQYESRPDKVKISMVMRRNSALGAWWAKCYRNYRGALNHIPFWRYVGTSVFLVILNIVGAVFSCSLVAYSFARLQWPGRNFCFGLMLATMMIPPQVTMIPFFLIMKHLGWYNTLKPLWVISFFGNAFNIFLLRQFMKGIPRDLEDAARIDGCNFMQVYWYVIMPLIKPTLACIAIFTFMAVWNDFMGPLIYLSDQRLYPLSLGLYAFNVQVGTNYGMMMAGSLLMTLPVIVVFFFAQKYFIQGVTLTGIKG